MQADLKRLTDFLLDQGVEAIGHTNKTYMGHLLGVYRLMKANDCSEEVCQAGMFHSIYGTELFQGFKLPLERRPQIRDLIGERAEKLAYINCAMNRASFDKAVEEKRADHRVLDRLTAQEIELSGEEFDDLCRVHLYDWLEQVPRSQYGYGYRRRAFRLMAERLGPTAIRAYDGIFAQEPPA